MNVSFRILLRQVLVLLLLPLPAAFVSALFHPKPPVWQEEVLAPGEVRLDTVLGWENVLWVDARTQSEFQKEHIPGALLVNEDDWELLFTDFIDFYMENPDRPVVVYCGGARCQRSKKVAGRLRESLGTDEIFVLKGGWQEWSGQ